MTSQNFLNKLLTKRQANVPPTSSVSQDAIQKNPQDEPQNSALPVPVLSPTDRLEAQPDPTALILPLDHILEDRDQARKTFQDIDALADQIHKHGQLQAIVVQRLDDQQYRLLIGHRRYRAIKLLNQSHPGQYTMIKATLNEQADTVKRRLAQYCENTARENYAPLEEADELKLLMGLLNCTQKELAQQINKSESYVSKTLSLLKLNEAQKARIQSGEVSKKQATENKHPAIETEPATADPQQTDNTHHGHKDRLISRIAITQPVVHTLARLLQHLAEHPQINSIDLAKRPTRKELIAVIESRAADVFREVSREVSESVKKQHSTSEKKDE